MFHRFWMLALQGLMANPAFAGVARRSHFKPRAKRVILCYMSGGVSQVDSFDPKPKLRELHGKPMPVKIERTQFNNNGNVMASPFEFKRYGQSGTPVSSMFPHVAESVDELAVIRSMTSKVNEHAQGNYAFHTGFPFMGHPSAGAWVSYGLGTENQNMPGFVVLQAGGAAVAARWRGAVQQRLFAGTKPSLDYYRRQGTGGAQHPAARGRCHAAVATGFCEGDGCGFCETHRRQQ